MSATANTNIAPAEYERRRQFSDAIKGFRRSEHIEIARILQRAGVTISENRSGIYFDMAKLPQPVFDELLEFHEFIMKNNKELDQRDALLNSAS
jgi:hypothetical protein